MRVHARVFTTCGVFHVPAPADEAITPTEWAERVWRMLGNEEAVEACGHGATGGLPPADHTTGQLVTEPTIFAAHTVLRVVGFVA